MTRPLEVTRDRQKDVWVERQVRLENRLEQSQQTSKSEGRKEEGKSRVRRES